MGRRLALLIATYDYQDTGLRQLTAPAHDADALATVLKDPAIAGFKVTKLVNEPLQRIGEAIGDFYRDRRRDDLTLLYFTGHGLKDDDGRLYLAMTDTRRDNLLFTALSAEHIDQAMEGCRSQQKVLILDCCYSGAFPAGRFAKADTAVHALNRFQGRGRTVLTASDATQYSFEGNQPRGQAVQSVFTRYLVQGLRDGSADLDGDGDITLDELYNYVHDQVVEEMPQQRPKRQDNIEGRTVIAANINWTLPSYLRNAIGSPIANDRLGAVDQLTQLHQIGNDTVRRAVLDEIRALADDDSRLVSAAATAQLQRILPQSPEPLPEQPTGPTSHAAEQATRTAPVLHPGPATASAPSSRDGNPTTAAGSSPSLARAGPPTRSPQSVDSSAEPRPATAVIPSAPASTTKHGSQQPAVESSTTPPTLTEPQPGTGTDTGPNAGPTRDRTRSGGGSASAERSRTRGGPLRRGEPRAPETEPAPKAVRRPGSGTARQPASRPKLYRSPGAYRRLALVITVGVALVGGLSTSVWWAVTHYTSSTPRTTSSPSPSRSTASPSLPPKPARDTVADIGDQRVNTSAIMELSPCTAADIDPRLTASANNYAAKNPRLTLTVTAADPVMAVLTSGCRIDLSRTATTLSITSAGNDTTVWKSSQCTAGHDGQRWVQVLDPVRVTFHWDRHNTTQSCSATATIPDGTYIAGSSVLKHTPKTSFVLTGGSRGETSSASPSTSTSDEPTGAN